MALLRVQLIKQILESFFFIQKFLLNGGNSKSILKKKTEKLTTNDGLANIHWLKKYVWQTRIYYVYARNISLIQI